MSVWEKTYQDERHVIDNSEPWLSEEENLTELGDTKRTINLDAKLVVRTRSLKTLARDDERNSFYLLSLGIRFCGAGH